MAAFDPAAATAAYLAVLSPQAHAKAQAYTQGGHWLLLWGTLVSLIVAWIMLKSGVLVRVRSRVEGGRRRPWRAVAAVVVVAGLMETVLTLPWSVYARWWRETQYGMTSQPFGGWLGEWALSGVIDLVMTVILLSLVYWLIRRAPRTWWAWGGAVVTLFMGVMLILGPVLIEPLFNSYKPAPPGPVRDAIVQMAKDNGVPSDRIFIYDGSKQSNRYTANVSGLFGTARVAMSDVMFKKDADLAEVKAVVGHEMGHYKQLHMWWIAATFGVLALIALFVVDRLFGWTARRMGADGVQGLSDPAGYPVVSMIVSVLALLATPLINTVGRVPEAQADQFSLEHVNEPDGLAKALVKTIEYRAATPSRLEEIIFYDHPSVGARVRRAMEWKAKHPKAAGQGGPPP